MSLPPVGSLVVYFPQGHSEQVQDLSVYSRNELIQGIFSENFLVVVILYQVAASMHKELDTVPSYPSLPSKLICKLLSLTLHVCQC